MQDSDSQAETPVFNSIAQAQVQNASLLVVKLDRNLLVDPSKDLGALLVDRTTMFVIFLSNYLPTAPPGLLHCVCICMCTTPKLLVPCMAAACQSASQP